MEFLIHPADDDNEYVITITKKPKHSEKKGKTDKIWIEFGDLSATQLNCLVSNIPSCIELAWLWIGIIDSGISRKEYNIVTSHK